MKRLIVFISLYCCLVTAALAQSFTLKGNVKDDMGEGAIGATVKVVGSQNGTVTDFDGNFALQGVKVGDQISISYVGYQTETVKVSGQAPVNVTLKPDSKVIDEVVVVGYGAQKKSSISGSVSTIKTDELPKAASASLGEMLRGRASGVNIQSSSSSPGAELNINVRGNLTGKAPLIVIDGVPQVSSSNVSSSSGYSGYNKDQGMINLNPDDIETINILKDASAAAIYGSDAAGGVILITTKRGKNGAPEISYTGSVALQFIKDKPEVLSAKDYMTQVNKVFEETGGSPRFAQSQIDQFVGKGTDWMDEVTRTGVVNEHTLSVSAGTEKTKYLFSVGLYDQQGIAKNSGMNRLTGRINIDQEFTKRLKGGINTSFAQIKYDDVPAGDDHITNLPLFYSAMTFMPVVPVRDTDGNYSDNSIMPNKFPNPVSLLDITTKTKSRNLFLSGYLEYKPIDVLTLRATVGVDMKDTQFDQYIPTTTLKGKSTNGRGEKTNGKAQTNLINVIATYADRFADKHDLSVMGGWEYKQKAWEGMGMVASQFTSDGALMHNMASAGQKDQISSYKSTEEMASFIGRINYTFLDRYILTMNMRVDGSSNFTDKHQWGFFPGVSAAWRINEEAWLKNVDWVSNLKLRAGYGQTGNPGDLSSNTRTVYKANEGSPYYFGDGAAGGVQLDKLGNSNLKWETLTDINAGLDFGFLRNRITGTIEVYQRTRSDIIGYRSLMSYSEIKTIAYNSKQRERSRGIDISLSTVNFDTKTFGWTTDINLSFYRNTYIDRDEENTLAPYRPWDNENKDAVYGYLTDGLIGQGESYGHLKAGAGGVKYLDVNQFKTDEEGNIVLDSHGRRIIVPGADGVLDEADMVRLYNNTPIPFSINNTFRWKNWDANIYLYGSLGGRRINNVKYQSVIGLQDLTQGFNATTDILDHWSDTNPNGTMPGVAEVNSGVDVWNSDFFVEKAWYLRLDNISVGYTFPVKWFGGYVKAARLYGSARNLCVITPYEGIDPENNGTISPYPTQRSFALGLSLKF